MGLEVLEPLEVHYRPDDDELEACIELGRRVARRVKDQEG
jgi:flavorubredoxin